MHGLGLKTDPIPKAFLIIISGAIHAKSAAGKAESETILIRQIEHKLKCQPQASDVGDPKAVEDESQRQTH
jgi:hypothetical protein